jgi:hypothetical protein
MNTIKPNASINNIIDGIRYYSGRDNNASSTEHGSPHDRGRADAWYGRDPLPHYFEGDSFMSARVDLQEMTQQEIQAYHGGYMAQFTSNERKEY